MAALAAHLRTLRLPKPTVIAIVDDDEAVRELLFDLLQVEGLPARTFSSAAAFLLRIRPAASTALSPTSGCRRSMGSSCSGSSARAAR